MPRHSLKGKGNIQATLKNGKRYMSDKLALYHYQNIPGLENDYGVAFLLSGKSGKAVERNKIKRWLREDFRGLQSNNKRNGAFVIKFFGTAANVTHRTLTDEMNRLYCKVRA